MNEKYIILRFVSWSATHDFGHRGLNLQMKRKIINELSKFAKIIITSESPLPKDLEVYRMTIPPERIHDALKYASLYIGEGATMASESAILGTPAIYVNSLKLGYIEEEIDYGLIKQRRNANEIIQEAITLIKQDNNNNIPKSQEKLLADTIDLTEYLVDLVENYPDYEIE